MKYSYLVIAMTLLIGLSLISLFVGVSEISLRALRSDQTVRNLLFVSRVPRTVSLLLTGSGMAIAGVIMQCLVQNRFVEPFLVGTTQSAGLGLLVVLIIAPSAPVMIKMVISSGFAMLGTLLFLFILRRVVLKSVIMVPLVGIMLSAVIGALTVFIALYFDLLQTLTSWMNGDFSAVMKGRYELLWLVGLLIVLAMRLMDKFTIVGMGRSFAVNIGLNYDGMILIGMAMVAIISSIVVIVIGMLPFLGLIIPNLIALIRGDNIRSTLPWIGLSGAGLTLLCDIVGRLLDYPFEIPVSVVLGVVGAIIFLFLLYKRCGYKGY